MDIRVGDKWRCRNGEIAVIEYDDPSNNYRWQGQAARLHYSWDENGRVYRHDISDYDLIELYSRIIEVDNRSSLELFRAVLGGKPVYHEFET